MELGVAGCRLVELKVMGDERGSLIALERATGVPFPIARAYYIFGTKEGVSRGFHAHRRLRQWMIPLAGGCTMLLDDSRQRAQVRLDRLDRALEVGPMVWREMHDFTPDCVLLVLADAAYDAADYLRDHEAFRAAAAAAEPQ
jgi:dTDP-4-dehydrorhamnose 3,5-epimerase